MVVWSVSVSSDRRIRRAEVADILDLRWRVLRVGRPIETAHLAGDDHPDTQHWCVEEGGEVVGCLSLMAATEPEGSVALQLRGMAVDPARQNGGVGAALLRAVMSAVDRPMWCNARERAVPFYERAGWEITSDRFEIPAIGPHHRMRWDGAHLLARGRHLALVRRGTWEYARRTGVSGVVAIIAITDEDELVLVRQHRVPVGSTVVELPAGLAGDLTDAREEDLVDAARRELEEETGFCASSWSVLGESPVSAGLTSETVQLFLATGLTRHGEGGGDDSEDIEVHRIPLSEVPTWVRSRQELGEMVDYKVWVGLWYAAQR